MYVQKKKRYKKIIDMKFGIGWYNVKYCLLFAFFLIASIVEVMGYAYVLPSAKCDLEIDDSQRGLIASMPYIAICITSFPWGYLIDTRGRKYILLISSLGAGIFGIAAAFMPDLISFTVMKLLGSLCLACPGAAPYPFISEILPLKHRDLALSITNSMQSIGSVFVPLLAWIILPLDFNIDFGLYSFRPWRLLTIIYSFLFLLCAFLMYLGPESPKFLVSQGQHDNALKVLQDMYAGNNFRSHKPFPVTRLKIDSNLSVKVKDDSKQNFFTSIKVQSLPLLTPPYLKWMVLNGFLLFGIFSVLNGLNMWVPEVLNRVFTGSTDGATTACEVMRQSINTTDSIEVTCIDEIDLMTFRIHLIAIVSVSVVTLAGSGLLKLIGKKFLLIIMYLILGSFCIALNFVTQEILFAILLSSVQISALGIGPVNAYAVQLFPTELRGMAVTLGLMLGRLGSVVSTNVVGILINSACEATFYLYGSLLLLCGLLSLLLPNT